MIRDTRPTVALIYDFDGTLSPKNMQEYDFIKAIGVKDTSEFWAESRRMAHRHNADSILCYMKLMLDKAHAHHVSIKREQFVNFGKSIDLYPGVCEWFDLIRALGDRHNVKIEHYINSSGLREMIEGTPIAHHFEEIYACEFLYEDDVAVWPAVAVDFTAKTQFLFMINKGVRKIYNNRQVNAYMAEDERPVPFSQMIYFGDGETDIPCMRLVKQQGGTAIAVYKPRNVAMKASASQLVRDKRVNFACAANYTEQGEMYSIVEATIRQISLNYQFRRLQESNLKKLR